MSSTDLSAWLEKRDAERLSARLEIKFKPVTRQEADGILMAGDFSDVFATSGLQEDEPDGAVPKDAFTENISINGLRLVGDLQLVGGKSLSQGAYLLVEIKVPETPIPVRALAMVIWSEADPQDPKLFHAGLFFVGINKHDVTKVARFMVLQRRAKQ